MASEYGRNFRSPKVNIHDFSMIPRAQIPRSSFRMEHQHKTTINCSSLTPVYLQEVLPGDTFNTSMTVFARLSTPIYPLMDTIELESFFFFVPNRLVWTHWKQFQGEQNSPADTISYSIPQVVSPIGGFARLSLYDYMGLPCTGQTAGGNTISVNALPFRCYNLIFSEWFRDENLVNGLVYGSTSATGYGGSAVMDDGPDPQTNYTLQTVAKRHDYFTSGLPWTQKGAAGAVTLPLGTTATVRANATALITGAATPASWTQSSGTAMGTSLTWASGTGATSGQVGTTATAGTMTSGGLYPNNLYADLSTATAATINQIRLAFQTQKLLERDARGGTRYTEIVRSHFGVTSPDMRLQRPEYLGGGKTPVNITPVPSTIPSTFSGTSNPPMGTLAATGTAVQTHGFRQSFTEHGYILGLVTARADQLYQQGIRKLWSRLTRYDFYMPVFAMLGEQSILNKELFSDGSANDALTFAFQERWAEYRYHPSFTTGYFNSTNPTPIDAWHLGVKFSALPVLNASWIQDPTFTIIQRNLALAAQSVGQQLLCDFFFSERVARPMPMYSVPGLIDHF